MKTMYWEILFPESISLLTNFTTDTGVGQSPGYLHVFFDVLGVKAQWMGVHSGQALGSLGERREEELVRQG